MSHVWRGLARLGRTQTDQNVGKWRTALAPELLEQLLEVKFQIQDDPNQYAFGSLLNAVGYRRSA